jgi:DNA helicase-2/ATP-dependent DNA helicase PcrA
MNLQDRNEQIARDICGKPAGITMEECHRTFGRRNALCGDHKTCRIAEKSEEQTNYVLSSIQGNTFLRACPGSGKTEVVGLKAAYEIKKWDRSLGGIAVVTFTNAAADVIAQRASQFTSLDKIGYPHFIGTIDSWLHGYVAHPFAHLRTEYQGKEGDRSIHLVTASDSGGWLNAYKLKTLFFFGKQIEGSEESDANEHSSPNGIPLFANNVHFDLETRKWQIKVPRLKGNDGRADDDYFQSAAFQAFRGDKTWLTLDYMRQGFDEGKERFLRAGFATYQDIEYLCFRLLDESPRLALLFAKRFPLIIVDECQDLSWTQTQILRMLMDRGSCVHLVGDLNQAIWEFRKVDPQKVRAFADEHSFFEMRLAQNFRSCQPIVDVCGRLVSNGRRVSSTNAPRLEHPCICVCYDRTGMAELPRWFADYLDQLKINKERSAILTRGWSNVSRMRPSDSDKVKNHQHRLALAINLWKSGCRQATGDALKCVGHFLAEKYFSKVATDSRQYYRPECVDSPVRWRLFLAGVLKDCCEHMSINDLTQTWKKWVLAVRKHFASFARQRLWMLDIRDIEQRGLDFPDLDGRLFPVPRNEGDKSVESSLPSAQSGVDGSLQITTIHSVKGKTLGAVMLVSAPTMQGTSDGHWTQWLMDPASEAARLAYVASSRPEHLLAWAVPSATDAEKSRLQCLGFHFVDM